MPESAATSSFAPAIMRVEASPPSGSLTVGLIKSQAIADGHANKIASDLVNNLYGEQSQFFTGRNYQLFMSPLKLSRQDVEEFYAEHLGKPYFEGLVESVSGKDGVIAIFMHGEGVMDGWRGLMGPTNPQVARETAPGSLRALYATEMPHTAVHGAATDAEALAQWKILERALLKNQREILERTLLASKRESSDNAA